MNNHILERSSNILSVKNNLTESQPFQLNIDLQLDSEHVSIDSLDICADKQVNWIVCATIVICTVDFQICHEKQDLIVRQRSLEGVEIQSCSLLSVIHSVVIIRHSTRIL